MRRLIGGIVTAGVVLVPLSLYVDSDVSPTTPSVAILAGVTFGALAATMLRSTRGWSVRAVGLLLMLAGAAVLLTELGVGLIWPIADRAREATRDVVLALWIVGVPLSLFGVITFWLGGDPPRDDDREVT